MSLRPAASFALVLALSASSVTVSEARWSAEPTRLYATREWCPQLAAASDQADGAIVAFESSDTTAVDRYALRAIHVRADGTLDPTWAAVPVPLTDYTGIRRTALGAVSDDAGGAYVWWMEGASLYLTRIQADGQRSSAWPARGRAIGTLLGTSWRPQVRPDGSGGVYVAWLQGNQGRILRLGPLNTGAGGWPNSYRFYAASDPSGSSVTVQFTIEVAPDGGLWLGWGDVALESQVRIPGVWRVSRTQPNGAYASGWSSSGVPVATFRSDALANPFNLPARLISVGDAGDGGVYVACAEMAEDGSGYWPARAHRLLPDRTLPEGWSAEGVALATVGLPLPEAGRAEYSFEMAPLASGGVLAFHPSFYSEGASDLMATRVRPDGSTQSHARSFHAFGREIVTHPSGAVVIAEFVPNGPYGPYSPYAQLSAMCTAPNGADGPSFHEYHPEVVVGFYGDIALARASGDGALFLWSQERERFGIYAHRFTSAGLVTAVPDPAAPVRKLGLRYVPGRGVIADGALAPGRRLSVHDVSGRCLLEARTPGDSSGPFTLPGSDALQPGVYFVRATLRDGTSATAKVVVWR